MREFAAFIMRSRLHAIAIVGLFGVFSLKVLPLGLLSAAARSVWWPCAKAGWRVW